MTDLKSNRDTVTNTCLKSYRIISLSTRSSHLKDEYDDGII